METKGVERFYESVGDDKMDIYCVIKAIYIGPDFCIKKNSYFFATYMFFYYRWDVCNFCNHF